MATNGYLSRRRAAMDTVATKASNRAAELSAWLACVALNDEFGFAGERCRRFLLKLEAVADIFAEDRKEDEDVALEHLRRRLEKVLEQKVERTD